MPKIVISVRGGVVQDVYSSDPATEVEIFDWDDIEDDDSTDPGSKEEDFQNQIETMSVVY